MCWLTSATTLKAPRTAPPGWEALQNNSYDLVITDNKMPRMTGIEMIEKLRSATMTLPVIMATRYLPTHEFVRRPWLKPDAALERPFSNDELLAAVKKFCIQMTAAMITERRCFRCISEPAQSICYFRFRL